MGFALSSVPEILSRYGSLNAAVRQTGFSDTTIRRYQFDYKCEHHIIVNGVLMTARNTAQRLVIESNKPTEYEFINNQLVRKEQNASN